MALRSATRSGVIRRPYERLGLSIASRRLRITCKATTRNFERFVVNPLMGLIVVHVAICLQGLRAYAICRATYILRSISLTAATWLVEIRHYSRTTSDRHLEKFGQG